MKKIALAIFFIGLILTTASSVLSTPNSLKQLEASNINLEDKNLFANSVNCSTWSLQPDGCYERVCCCDSNGQHWCERCCPDKDGKCNPYKVKC